jgi:hypothetical protein
MTICIPRATGVPGLPTAPNWFDSTAGAPPLRTELDDPRWVGAYKRGFGDGTGLEAEFRGLYMNPDWRGKKSLFLSWNVVFDGSLDNGLDRVYLGFNNGGTAATDSLIFKFITYNSSSADIVAGAFGSVQLFNLNAAGEGVPLLAVPPWVNHTKAWLTRTPIGWAIHMYVPHDPAAAGLFSNDGINLPDPFQFFYQIYVLTPTRVSGGAAVGGFVTHKWPLTSANVFTGLNGDVYPNPPATAWDSFHPSTGPGDPMCLGVGGVTIDSSGLGNMVDGGPPNITIRFRKTTPPPRPVNNLFANVDNQTGATIPVGAITAKFRIADWGSVIMDPNAPWDDVRGGGAVSNAVPIPVGKPVVTAGNPPPLNFTWTLNDAEMDPYIAGKPSDQCILVELSGAGINFLRDSARQNHLILPASQVVRPAQISVEGLAPIPGGGVNRDVYVAIETRHMQPPSGEGGTTVVWDEQKVAILRRRDIGSDVLETLVNQGMLAAFATGQLRLDHVFDLAPLYRVHVYHDTGQQLTVDGTSYPILEAQSSFAMIPDHAGPFKGWEHSLDFPPGAVQDEITPSFFRIHVPNNGKITTQVRIEAVEPFRIPWWVWLLLFLLLLLIILLFT